MLEHVRCRAGDPAAQRLAEAFGTSYRLTDSPEDDGESGGTFRAAATAAGIPVVTAELSNSRRIAQSAVAAGVDGMRNLLRERGVLPGEPDTRTDQTVLRNDAEPVTASASGLFEPRPDVGVGDTVDAGERLGTVYEPSSFEQQQVVSATERGVVFSLARESVAVKGERLAGIATPR
jgi:predicted deacylase